jgi:hypothetical protein
LFTMSPECFYADTAGEEEKEEPVWGVGRGWALHQQRGRTTMLRGTASPTRRDV